MRSVREVCADFSGVGMILRVARPENIPVALFGAACRRQSRVEGGSVLLRELSGVGLAHFADHDLENLTVGMYHAFTGQRAKIGDRIIDTVLDDAFVAGDA